METIKQSLPILLGLFGLIASIVGTYATFYGIKLSLKANREYKRLLKVGVFQDIRELINQIEREKVSFDIHSNQYNGPNNELVSSAHQRLFTVQATLESIQKKLSDILNVNQRTNS